MKILLISSSFYPKIDGSTRCVYDHARKLAGRGNTVYLATRGIKGVPKYEVYHGVHVVRSAVEFRSGTPLNKLSLILEQILMILRLHRRIRFDVIHVHGYAAGIAAIPCKYLFRVPVFITTHGTELLWPKELWWKDPRELKLGLLFERFVLRHCDVIIAQSEGVRAYMLQIYGRDLASKIVLVHTGVDHESFRPPPPLNGGAVVNRQVLFVGALSEIKGVTCLLDAFNDLHSEVPQARLVLVGSGPRAQRYKDYVNDHQLNGSVTFSGPVRDDERLLHLYWGSDVVVLPSNVGGPISCTIMEGLSCGRAVISTDVPGGIPDVLSGGVGLLMDRGNAVQLASYLRRLMTDRDYLLTLEHNARSAVEERYTLELMIDKLMLLYNNRMGVPKK